jgi:hypothetical protein
MNRFPEDYILHNLPLIILSGLSDGDDQQAPESPSRARTYLQDGGFRIRIDAPTVDGTLAQQVLQAFRDQDASAIPWHSQAVASRSSRVFKIETSGRVGQIIPLGQ